MTETKPRNSVGQVIPRGEHRWLIRWFLGRDGTGKRRYGSRTVHGTKKDAQKALREKLQQRDLGVVVLSRRVTVNAYLDEWLEKAARGRLRPRTFADYKEKLKRYVRPILGLQRLDRLTPLDVQGMVTQLSVEGCPTVDPKDREPLAPQTVRYAHAILSGALEQAVRWQMLAANPARRVELPKNRRREMQALTPAQAAKLREVLAGTRYEALFLLLLGTGLRPGEALALQWGDLDLEAGRATVQRTLPRRKQREALAFEDPKTARSRRVVPLPPTVVQALRRHRAHQAEERIALGAEWSDHGLLFTTELGEPANYRNLVRRHFKKALERAELPLTLRLYDLRHSFASLAMAAGAHVKAIADRLGHSSTKMTLDVYSHVLEPVERDATSRIEQAVFGA
jgi:integrase